MNKTDIYIENKLCTIYYDDIPDYILIQPTDKREFELIDKEIGHIKNLTGSHFAFAAFEITDWNNELSPWTAPPIFGNDPFGDGAKKTLDFIEKIFIPKLKNKFGADIPIILGGYSLAGLFSLWSAYSSDKFNAIAAVSPSVWFPDWLKFIENHSPFSKNIYLSLGKKEEKTRNKIMAAVGKNINRQFEKINENCINCILEWNEGNHFTEPEIRTAKGFAWCINTLSAASVQKGDI